MAVYYKFKSDKDYNSVSIDGHFITVASLKEKIWLIKRLGTGREYDLLVYNAQTNEEYLNEDMLIPKNTSVLVRRIPGPPRKPLVAAAPLTTDHAEPKGVTELERAQQAESNFSGAGLSDTNNIDGSEYDDFGDDMFKIPEPVPVMSSQAEEDAKILALVNTPALDWQQQSFDGFGAGRGFGRGMGGRMGARGFGRGGGFVSKIPPPGYVCHRCKTPGHFIQYCPTNGDPEFDVKRAKPLTGIPKSMLMATEDGSYSLSSGSVAVLKPNEVVFEKEIEGMPSTRTVSNLGPEHHCPICKQVMKDAVLTTKCCFKSYCDKCIRDHIIDKSACACGATNVLADNLVPNTTVRNTISRESNNSSIENGSSGVTHVQDTESAKRAPSPQPKISSPTLSTKCDISDITEVGKKQKQKKKEKKIVNMSEAEMQWRASLEYAPKNCMTPPWPNPYYPYWNGMQPGIDAFMGLYGGGGMPYMSGYGLGPTDVPFGLMMPPFIPPQSSEELPKERESSREARRSEDRLPINSKTTPSSDRRHHHKTERLSPDHSHFRDDESDASPRRSLKRKSSDDDPHSKRRRQSRYEPSPVRERHGDREHDRARHSKHR